MHSLSPTPVDARIPRQQTPTSVVGEYQVKRRGVLACAGEGRGVCKQGWGEERERGMTKNK